MARKLAKKARVKQTDHDAAARAVLELVGGARKKPKRRSGPQSERWQDETRMLMKNGEWGGAGPQHLVALYIILHEWCYDVAPADMKGQVLLGARSSVNKLLTKEFGGDIFACVDYIKWAWSREKGREDWRREKGVPGRRLLWRHLFMYGQVLTDYRIDAARQAHG